MTELEQIQAEISGTTQAFEMVIALLLAKAYENEDSPVDYLETVLQDFKRLINNSLNEAEALGVNFPEEQVGQYIKNHIESAESTLDDVFENAMYLITSKRR